MKKSADVETVPVMETNMNFHSNLAVTLLWVTKWPTGSHLHKYDDYSSGERTLDPEDTSRCTNY